MITEKKDERERIIDLIQSEYPDLKCIEDRNIFIDWKNLLVRNIKEGKNDN